MIVIVFPRVLKHISPREIQALTSELVRIPSINPPGEEETVAKYLGEKLESIGFDVSYQRVKPKRSNVVGVLKGRGAGRTLLLMGHLDVVPPGEYEAWTHDPFSGHVDGGLIYGRGSTDMKGGLAAMLVAAKAVATVDCLKGTLIIAGVVDEETGGIGVDALISSGLRADMAVIGEPTNLSIVTAHKGIIILQITTRGSAVHSSLVKYDDLSTNNNAIYKMVEIIRGLREYQRKLELGQHPLLGSATLNVGTIEGGEKANIVPDRCSITLDRRLLPQESPRKAVEDLKKIMAKAKYGSSRVEVELKILAEREAASISQDEPVVRHCRDALQSIIQGEVKIEGYPATTDMTVLLKKGRIPTVLLGPGHLEAAHTVNESVEIKQLILASKVYAHLILNSLR